MWDLGSGMVELLLPIVVRVASNDDDAMPEPQEDGAGLT